MISSNTQHPRSSSGCLPVYRAVCSVCLRVVSVHLASGYGTHMACLFKLCVCGWCQFFSPLDKEHTWPACSSTSLHVPSLSVLHSADLSAFCLAVCTAGYLTLCVCSFWGSVYTNDKPHLCILLTGGVPASRLRGLESMGCHQSAASPAVQVPAFGRHDVSG